MDKDTYDLETLDINELHILLAEQHRIVTALQKAVGRDDDALRDAINYRDEIKAQIEARR